MYDMEKLSIIEYFSKLFVLSISTNKGSEPIISDHQSRDEP